MIKRHHVAALAAFAAAAGAAATALLLFAPVTAKIDPSQLPDPRPVVSGTYDPGLYTPFTRPPRPPHPPEIYRPPTEDAPVTRSTR